MAIQYVAPGRFQLSIDSTVYLVTGLIAISMGVSPLALEKAVLLALATGHPLKILC